MWLDTFTNEPTNGEINSQSYHEINANYAQSDIATTNTLAACQCGGGRCIVLGKA
jgi:hypothetical protein